MRLFKYAPIMAMAAIGGLSATTHAQYGDDNMDHQQMAYGDDGMMHKFLSAEYVEFHNQMRELWTEHAVATRIFIISEAQDLPGKEATVERLMQNQVDMGNAIGMFYGDEAGDRLTELLKAHILLAVEVVTAAEADDEAALIAANLLWHENGDDIAEFLSAANPAWEEDEMREMMYAHLDLTAKEAVAYLSGDYETSVEVYDQVYEQILHMADMLAMGIMMQYPERFNVNGAMEYESAQNGRNGRSNMRATMEAEYDRDEYQVMRRHRMRFFGVFTPSRSR